MCLALIAINQHPRYPLIILSNRDEFYQRATIAAHYWPDYPQLFAGKDLEAGGTWLGVNRQGNFALLTNYRNPGVHSDTMKSRGLLVKNYLTANPAAAPSHYIEQIASMADQYNPFNLFVGNTQEVIYYSNVAKINSKLTTGLYGISNHLLETPWFKVLRAKKAFNRVKNDLLHYETPEHIGDLLFPILEDRTLAPNHLLPHTGVPTELEKSLSSIFVYVPYHGYGTRCSNLILFSDKESFFSERIFINGQATTLQTTQISFLN
ncbi:MAG: NRDE family protein [Legionella sp.]|uniref:NRDE family protein n=1 Tax=Legionella sp. TaxID=459 RepID=UPI0039E7240F